MTRLLKTFWPVKARCNQHITGLLSWDGEKGLKGLK